jgi:hypothetical protein
MIRSVLLIGSLILIQFIAGGSSNQNVWKDCGSTVIILEQLDIQPIPIIHPGIMNLTAVGRIDRPIRGEILAEIEVVRKFESLKIPLKW